MPSPGEYHPDSRIGINTPHDLPPTLQKRQTRNRKYTPCPLCGQRRSRKRTAKRTLYALGNAETGRPVDINFVFSVHRCNDCEKYFSIDLTGIADSDSH